MTAHLPLGSIILDATPVGALTITAGEGGLLRIEFGAFREDYPKPPHEVQKVLDFSRSQLSAYFAGELRQFDLPLDWERMRPFQQAVLRAVYAIPYGEVRTYAQIAAQIGKPGAVRAVGTANARNPLPLVIPCHRVIGSDGSLHGYGAPGGLETKAWLLQLEGAMF
ncbi:MAG TPA: methylated-DNA--[protein]-cysteine S-methyltransferase [Anaerolineaceae bacterium]